MIFLKSKLKSTHLSAYFKLLGRMAEARRAAGISQEELGKILHTRQTYVSKVELGERRIDLVEYVWWARAIGLNPAEGVDFLASDMELSQDRRTTGTRGKSPLKSNERVKRK